MAFCFFVTDLHGDKNKYEKLFKVIREEKPEVVFVGGDILPHGLISLSDSMADINCFINDYLGRNFKNLKNELGNFYPKIYIILGNDDARNNEEIIINLEAEGIWEYLHNKKSLFNKYTIYGYSFIPPSPFLLKDWEKYDVSRYVDPGCVPPEEGIHTVNVDRRNLQFSTIKEDLELLTNNEDLKNSILLFHSPPYQTKLDRADLEGKMIENAPVDVNVGSIAIKKFIEEKQPLLTLHGHIHESSRLTGYWKDKIGRTLCLSAAIDTRELAIIKFNLDEIDKVVRVLL
jgi:uncharacterized protein